MGITIGGVTFLIFMIKTGTDPDNKARYIKLAKNTIIASILITLSLTLLEIPKSYFGSPIGIADEGTSDITFGKLQDKDCQGREVVNIDGKVYVVTDTDVELNTMGLSIYMADKRAVNINTMKHCSVLRSFSECQGTFKGYFAQIKYYRDEDGFIFPAGTSYTEYLQQKGYYSNKGFGFGGGGGSR